MLSCCINLSILILSCYIKFVHFRFRLLYKFVHFSFVLLYKFVHFGNSFHFSAVLPCTNHNLQLLGTTGKFGCIQCTCTRQSILISNSWAFWAATSENVTFGHVHPAKIQISLRNRAVWSESSLSAFWITKDAKFLYVDNEDSNQTARMRRLIWVFVGRTYKKVRFRPLRLILRYFYSAIINCICFCVYFLRSLAFSSRFSSDKLIKRIDNFRRFCILHKVYRKTC